MRYELPTIRSTKTGFVNLARLAAETETMVDLELALDFSKCGFFDANMTAPLQVVLEKFVDCGKSVDLVGLPPNIETILCKNEFLCQFGRRKVFDLNKTTLPHVTFGLSDGTKFADYLDLHLPGKGIPNMSAGLVKSFRKSIFEIFQNCVMHSRSLGGVTVCGQFYPKDSHVNLTISDAGVGIRSNVKRFLGAEISSADAIKWAMVEGNTTKTGKQPGGFGLHLLQEFIELNQGRVQIVSNDGFYEFSNGVKKYELLRANLPGTTINFEINTNDTKSYRLSSETLPENPF